MIYDSIEHVALYSGLGQRIARGLDMLAAADFDMLPDGSRVLGDDEVFMNISTYETAPAESLRYETHSRYIDIQYMISGRERMAVSEPAALEPTEARPETDIWFYSGQANWHALEEGHFMLIYPHEAHGPGICRDTPALARKAVVKVRVD